jgi:replicative DNA helicase
VGHLGKFENLETFNYTGEFHSSMNDAANDDTFKTSHFPLPGEAFGSSMNDNLSSDDDVPF